MYFCICISYLKIELRQSRQSLAAASDRMSRASYAGSGIHGPAHSVVSSRRTRPRSRSRDQLNGAHIHSHHRPSSRYESFVSFSLIHHHHYCSIQPFSRLVFPSRLILHLQLTA